MHAPPPETHPAVSPETGKTDWKVLSLNAYLAVFAATGALAVLSHLPFPAAFQRAFGALASVAEIFSTLFAVWTLLLACSYKHLPWHPLAPALFLSFWRSFLLLPAPAYLPWKTVDQIWALGQSLVGAGTLLLLRRSSHERSPWLDARALPAPLFSWGRTLATFAAKLFLLLPLLVGYLLFSAQILVRELSAGFLEINARGVYTESRTYEHGGRMIYLLPTVHIAAPGFYDTLMQSLPEKRTVILPEGVTDRAHILKDRMDYSTAADSLGLTAQPDLTDRRKEHAVLPCDADISEFAPRTQTFLTLAGKLLQIQSLAPEDLPPLLASLQSFQDADLKILVNDILEVRNAKVLGSLPLALEKYEHVAIPWGAAHMPGIEREIQKLSARRVATRKVEVLKWSDIHLPSLRSR